MCSVVVRLPQHRRPDNPWQVSKSRSTSMFETCVIYSVTYKFEGVVSRVSGRGQIECISMHYYDVPISRGMITSLGIVISKCLNSIVIHK